MRIYEDTFVTGMLLISSFNASAECNLLVEHNLNYTILDDLKETLPKTINIQEEGVADFGIKEVKSSTSPLSFRIIKI